MKIIPELRRGYLFNAEIEKNKKIMEDKSRMTLIFFSVLSRSWEKIPVLLLYSQCPDVKLKYSLPRPWGRTGGLLS